MKTRAIYLTVCGVVMAGIVHIAIVLMIPQFGSRDAWNLLSKSNDLWTFADMGPGSEGEKLLANTDPYFRLGACTFDLSQSGLRLQGDATALLWSASVFDENGAVVYSLNSRTAINDRLDLIVLTPVQMVELREAPPEEIDRAVVVEAEITKGFVILRQFMPDDTYLQVTNAIMRNVVCGPYHSRPQEVLG